MLTALEALVLIVAMLMGPGLLIANVLASSGADAATPISTEVAVIGMLVVAAAVAMLARRFRLPFTIALVLAGLGIGAARNVLPAELFTLHLSESLLMAVLLPALLFEAAFHVNLTDFKANIRIILLLALPGVAIGILLAGGAFSVVLPWFGLEVSLLVACLIGSMLAATDPVSVIALFKELGAPKRLALIMEGESLLNDGVAVVAFTVLAAAAGYGAQAGQVDAVWVIKFMVIEIGGGLLIGLVVGAGISWALSLTDDHMVEITLTTIAAYGAYLLADHLHASGVIAVVAAGMMCGNFGARHGLSPSSRMTVISFWEYVAFAINSIVFILIGAEIEFDSLLRALPAAATVVVILLLARSAVVLAAAALSAGREARLDAGWRPALIWGGLRGGISMVLALWLSQHDTERGLAIRDLVFAVVLIILLVQGTTIGPLLSRLGLVFASAERERLAALRAEMRAIKTALASLDRKLAEHAISSGAYEALRQQLAARQAQTEEALEAVSADDEVLQGEIQSLRNELAQVEKDTVHQAYAKGRLSEKSMRQLIADIDATTDNPEH